MHISFTQLLLILWVTPTGLAPIVSAHPLAAHLPLNLRGQLIKEVLALRQRAQVLSWHRLQAVQDVHGNATQLNEGGLHTNF